MNYTLSKDIKNKGIVSVGNVNKIAEVLKKADEGKEISVAFLGGSITQGCKAEIHEKSYAYLTYLWFKDKFTKSQVKYINAGVGATGSVIGVHRVKREVLDFKPDIVFVDFAVNDKVDNYCKTAYESLIRRILISEKVPAVIEVFMSNEDFSNTQDQQIEIGKKYNLPMISYRNVLKNEIEKGSFKWEDVQEDEVHPNNNGHYILSHLLINFLTGVYSGEITGNNEEVALGQPLFGDKYVNGMIFDNKKVKVMKNEGFQEDEEGFQVFHNGWKSIGNDNAELNIELEGKNIFLLYRKSIEESAGKISVKVDDDEEFILDSFFKDGWGDFTEKNPIVEARQKAKHTISIKALDGDVYLMGFLVS